MYDEVSFSLGITPLQISTHNLFLLECRKLTIRRAENLNRCLTNSSLTHDPCHADEEHHSPDVQHAADLQEGGNITVGNCST